MIKIIFALAAFIPFVSFSQKDTSQISIPMKNGIIFYEKTFAINNQLTKEERYARALQWFTKMFGGSKEELQFSPDKNAGAIVGNGIFKIITSDAGNYYWVRPVIHIMVNDSGYTFQAYDYYEKPIESGITNDYSKLEYRWRDFRKGKPWSAEDQKLFKGVVENTLSLMASLEKEMSR